MFAYRLPILTQVGKNLGTGTCEKIDFWKAPNSCPEKLCD